MSTENLLRVPHIIDIIDVVVKSADPWETDVGRLRMDAILPKRVRASYRTGAPRAPTTTCVTRENATLVPRVALGRL